ncbi:alpha/beta fold hydrolase [Mesorhizobium sp. STM 4661]|uniref:alpha/beta hydrolase family protein n=1 Tax=Mesorhizobium sp. STM 4661 TaxID=1297570 RepID=UPI0002BF2867|nr:alpha/beta fold hydrolase [Mesorhizobium sp. STM 4661]CCV15914.1 conserved exported hypothetical protein [Mesorhizobium sp. STM 4661]
MRALSFIVSFLIVFSVSMAWAQPVPFHAGIARISVPAEEPFDTFVWYPTRAEEVPWQAGPFTVSASRNAAIADGEFPVLLLSHGGGRTGGGPLVLRGLAAYLARQGFIVVSPSHGKTRLSGRPLQIMAALEAMMADPRFKAHANPAKLGMLGFSLGGAVALELAGGVPNFRHLAAYCAMHPDDVQSCNPGPSGDSNTAPPKRVQSADLPPPRLPLKALALLDPFGVLFERDGLVAVKMPVLLFRPKQSRLGEENTRALVAGLPQPPRVQYVPGGHFVLTDICPVALMKQAPEVCEDAQDVDRAAVQADIEVKIAQFFRDRL